MAIALEKRINKLEKAMPGSPCRKKEHSRLRVFIYGHSLEEDRENDRILESIRQCKQCGDRSIVIFEHFGGYQAQNDHSQRFDIGDGEPVKVTLAQWAQPIEAPEDDASKLKRILSGYRGES